MEPRVALAIGHNCSLSGGERCGGGAHAPTNTMGDSRPADRPADGRPHRTGLPREPRPPHIATDAVQEFEFEWVRRLRDAGILMNPAAEARAASREAFLAVVREGSDERSTAARQA